MEYSKKLKEIAKEAQSWIKDWEKVNPNGVDLYDLETFEGSAYGIMCKIVNLSKQRN